MPAAKKPLVRRRAKTSSAATKTHHLTSKSTDNQSTASDALTPSKSEAFQTKTSPTPPIRQPLPMPVTPQRLPSKIYTPLIRTTYNSTWLKRLGLSLGIAFVAGVAFVGWTFRSHLPSFITSPGKDAADSITRLNITPTPTPDISKINQLSRQMANQATNSATEILPANQASSSAQLLESLQLSSDTSLKSELSTYITELDQQNVNTNNLKAYQSKVASLEAVGESEQAHQWLVEAVLHAHELAALQGYYQK